MAGVLIASQHGHMEQDNGHIVGMPQYWPPPPDERDAYIGWLKSEFAAANALIDSMCHHLHSMGGPGDYDLVFGCLNTRRHSWIPSLYLQSFFSVAEVVTALEDVAWKRRRYHHESSFATEACLSWGVRGEEAQDEAARQVEHHQRSDLCFNSIDCRTAASQQSEQVQAGYECLSTSSTCVRGVHVDTTAASETAKVETSHSPDSTLSTSAATCIIGCDKKTSHSACLDVKKLLNTEISIAAREEDVRRAIIKRSMQFQCCEHVDGQQMNDGESVELCEGVFNNKEIDEMIGIINQLQAAGRQGKLGCAFRGCEDASLLPDIMQFGPGKGNSTCIPKFLQAVIGWLTSCSILSPKKSPDSCCISILDEGSFEAPNTDQGAWEKPLCVISLTEGCSMVFGHSIHTDQYGSCRAPYCVTLPAGSVMLLQENFSGILQKCMPASLSRRVTIALGKAVSTSSGGEVNCVNAAGNRKKKYWATGGNKEGRLPPDTGLLSQRHLLALPPMQLRVPFVQPNVPLGLVLPPPAAVVPGLLRSSNAGTGVFFPSCDDSSGSVPTSWQSAMLVVSSSSLVASSRPVHSKRAGIHAKIKGAFGNLTEAQAPNKKLAACQNVIANQ